MKRYGSASSPMLSVITLIVGLLASTVSVAADELDVTMRMVMDDSDLMNSVVSEIELPQAVPSVPSTGRDHANERAAKGMDQRDAAHAAARDAREVTGRQDKIERPARPARPERPERPERDSVQPVDSIDRSELPAGGSDPAASRPEAPAR